MVKVSVARMPRHIHCSGFEMIGKKCFRALQALKDAFLSALALSGFVLIPLVWVPLIVGDWLQEKLKQRR
ncbi:hypothetical protein D3C84_1021430 [compost metagenome]